MSRDKRSNKTYRGFHIEYNPPPIPSRQFDWHATHPDFEADWKGEEDGWVGSHPSFNAPSEKELREEIDAYYIECADSYDHNLCSTCDGYGRIWNNADPTSGQCVPCDVCLDERGQP